MKKVEAIDTGIYNDTLRKAGDVFEVHDNMKLGRWMRLVEKAPASSPAQAQKPQAQKPQVKGHNIPDPKAPAPKAPDTFSEINKTKQVNSDLI